MAQQTFYQNFSSRTEYRIALTLTTSFTTSGGGLNATLVNIKANAEKYTYVNNAPNSTGSPRSYNVPNGRLSTGTVVASDSDSAWAFSFTAGSSTNFVTQVQPIWSEFNRIIRHTDPAPSVTITASHSLLGSASRTGSLPHVHRTTFDANGGTTGTSFLDQDSGGTIILPSATRSGFNFNGWYTASSGGTFVGNAGSSVSVTSTRTLFAQWVTANYTVSFDGNNGTSPSAQSVAPGNSITLPSSSRDGNSLIGWYTAASGGTFVGSAGSSYTPPSSITLFAQWSVNTFTISYNGNGATSGSTSSTSWTYPTSSGTVRNNGFTRTGFNFVGWNTNSSGTGTTYQPGSTYTADLTNSSGSVTLWAIWAASLPVFTDTSITTTGVIGRDIALNPDRTVAASPVQSYSLFYTGSGSNPTSWLTINNSGQLSGIPPAVGTYTFGVRANNGGSNNTDTGAPLSITVRPAGQRFGTSGSFVEPVLARRFDGANWIDLTIMRKWNGTSWENITN